MLRIAALAALTMWIALAALPRAGRRDSASVDALDAALPRWTSGDPVAAVQVRLDTAPDAAHVAWLAALRAAGVAVTWQGRVPGIAIETYPAADPTGSVFVAAATSGRAVLADELGPLDTLSAEITSIRFTTLDGAVTLTAGRQSARASGAGASPPKRVLVTGDAGWEPKFVIAALEENGWAVDARLTLGPGQQVDQGDGAAAPLDTNRYTAVVLLDSAAAERTAGVAAFVRAGGGVVLSGDASRARRVAELVAWSAGRHEAAPLGTPAADTAWRGLSRVTLSPVSDRGAIPLEQGYGVAVRRHYGGRVAAVAYDQTWRWRMAGAGNSLADHREWWSRVVASVARRPVILSGALALERSEGKEPLVGSAPLASLHASLGAPAEALSAIAYWWTSPLFANLLGAVVLFALVAEWLLRRSRGAR